MRCFKAPDSLRTDAILANLALMSIPVNLPEELVAQIDEINADRASFIEEAVRRLVRDSRGTGRDEVDRINALADELNREAEDVLEYQD